MIDSTLLIGLLLLLVLTALWAVQRTRRIRAAAAAREEMALARVRAGSDPVGAAGSDTIFEAAGLPSHMPARRGLEVAEHEVVDLEALLAGEPQGVARRARATLEEPTNVSLGGDTLPPAPRAAPAAAVAHVPTARASAAPVGPVSPATPSPVKVPAAPVARAGGSQPATPGGASVPLPVAASAAADASRAGSRAAQPSPPTLVVRLNDVAPSLAAAAAGPDTHGPVTAPPAPAGGSAPVRGASDDVPLRELALAWFEARGYRSAPASAAVRPIEQVLRHRHDPARAYAFVVENHRVTTDRVQQLRTQARSIGLLRLLVVANQGAENGAATSAKGVRLMDRASLAAEFDQLDFSVAAKIIAVARKRSRGAAPASLP